MKALVVYDSVFGNTEKVAQAIGETLGTRAETAVVRVTEIKPEQLTDIDLLIVGSPTRAFRPMPTIKAWYGALPLGALSGIKVAAFDTRIRLEDTTSGFLKRMSKWFGYAAEPMAKALQRKGGILAAPPAGFGVGDSEGPLKEGELERATAWAEQALKA